MIRLRRKTWLHRAIKPSGTPAEAGGLQLADGSRVAVVGGGPAGSFFSYFLLRMAATLDLPLEVEIYEPRFFTHCGPAGCNHCGGIVSESLVQLLAAEGINLPLEVVQRGISSYVLHMDAGTVRIESPLFEKRIAALYRGNGPRSNEPLSVYGFDRFLQDLAVSEGGRVRRQLVTGIDWVEGRPVIECADGARQAYDLVALASGINSHLIDRIADSRPTYGPPQVTKTFICEFRLGEETVERCFGSSMHVFLLDLPRLEFAALIPKGEFVTMCLLGDDIDEGLVRAFLDAPEVRTCFPDSRVPQNVCHCFPRINIRPARQPFADRMVVIGDSGVTRLYKDGIGSAYRTAKAAARTAVYSGISQEAFRAHYWPACRRITFDNALGHIVFTVSALIQRWRFSRRAVLRMTALEQQNGGRTRHMSSVMWDVFTGSAPYREVLLRTMRPSFMCSLVWNMLAANCLGGSAGVQRGGMAVGPGLSDIRVTGREKEERRG